MRRATSYAIVDRELLHGGYFERLSHQALTLYLFFLVVGDRDGRSFYRGATIAEKLTLTRDEFLAAVTELISAQLIEVRGKETWVLPLSTA